MIRSVHQDPVYQLLSTESNVVYTVPPFQREYSWGKGQWDELFDDLLDYEGGGGHFLGTIICLNDTRNATRQTELQLIDGQQRMTTLSLLLLAIYMELEEQAGLSEEDRQDQLNLRRMLTLRRPARARLQPQLQGANREDYYWLLSQALEPVADVPKQQPKWLGLRLMTKCLRHFRARLRAHAEAPESGSTPEALLIFLEKVKNAVVVKLEVESHSDAFTLFESLNNRGMPLTPIDLIKNTLLAKASSEGMSVEETYRRWSEWLEALGDTYTVQERFFRHFYNAFTVDPSIQLSGHTRATRPSLISIYEKLMDRDLEHLVERLSTAVEDYRYLMNGDRRRATALDRQLRNLAEVRGAASYMVLLYLKHRFRDELTGDQLAEAVKLLISFFIRRNFTNTPATNQIDRYFSQMLERLKQSEVHEVLPVMREMLQAISADDHTFRQSLLGPAYEENDAEARYLLTAFTEERMTRETWKDIWERVPVGSGGNTRYLWTIEHILPQGTNLPDEWVEMLGGPEAAKEAQAEHVHRLGNLTITAYNSSLSNMPFLQKRDRKDQNGNPVGFCNGLALNDDLAVAESWSVARIEERTQKFADYAVQRFSLDWG
ncbi:DUF262 domain-containing protein [Nesterenkonia populi]